MFGFGSKKKAQEAERLSEDLKRKISELHLLVVGGSLSAAQLEDVQKNLTELRKQLGEQTKVVRSLSNVQTA